MNVDPLTQESDTATGASYFDWQITLNFSATLMKLIFKAKEG